MQGLGIKTNLGEGILPVREAQVHYHQPEVVREGVRDEEPRTGEVLEPELGLVRVASVHQGKPTILDLGIDIKGCNVFPISN